jgi:hypothetical protein
MTLRLCRCSALHPSLHPLEALLRACVAVAPLLRVQRLQRARPARGKGVQELQPFDPGPARVFRVRGANPETIFFEVTDAGPPIS